MVKIETNKILKITGKGLLKAVTEEYISLEDAKTGDIDTIDMTLLKDLIGEEVMITIMNRKADGE